MESFSVYLNPSCSACGLVTRLVSAGSTPYCWRNEMRRGLETFSINKEDFDFSTCICHHFTVPICTTCFNQSLEFKTCWELVEYSPMLSQSLFFIKFQEVCNLDTRWKALSVFILRVLDANTGQWLAIVTGICHGFLRSFWANVRIILKIRNYLFSSTCCSLSHYWYITKKFSAIWNVLFIAKLSIWYLN
jgi:hypothetical protein